MPREVISTPEAREFPGYSQAVKVGNTIYVAGTVGVDVATGELAGPTIQEQMIRTACGRLLIGRRDSPKPRLWMYLCASVT
jgi:enamine deaminase RidA (YjgF/YER057c/UK114 family)